MYFENEDFNKMADEFLQRIKDYIDLKISENCCVRPAEIYRVNSDGTVDIFFPPDKDKLFTKIQNQTIYQNLKPGDQVYLFYPQGNASSCWVCAKFKKKQN